MDYITISSTGDASDFGNLIAGRESLDSTSSGTSDRGVFAGGWLGSISDSIDYITISSTGDASDFGDLSSGRYSYGATSNS